MEDRTEVEAEIRRAQGELVHKAHLLEARVVEVKDRVNHALDLHAHYRERPWHFVLASFVTGALTAWSLSSASPKG